MRTGGRPSGTRWGKGAGGTAPSPRSLDVTTRTAWSFAYRPWETTINRVRVLLLEDDTALRASVAAVLRPRGISVDEAALLAEADEKIRINDYDLVILDRLVPDGDAASLVARLREDGIATPVIFLTALDSVADRVAGLDVGADDYLVKPFAIEELLARIRSIGRRPLAFTGSQLSLADLVIDEGKVSVTRAERPITLTPKEFSLLTYLVRHAGRVVPRSEIFEHCWDEYADPTSNVIEVRMRLLRQKLGEPPLLHTVRGAGYVADVRE